MTRQLSALLISLLCAAPAFAAGDATPLASFRASERSSAAPEAEVGAIVGYMPMYAGAHDNKGVIAPYVEANFRNGFFASTMDGLGYRFLENANGFSASASLNATGMRREKDGRHDGINRLQGMGDIDPHLALNLLLNYDAGPWHAAAKLATTPGSRYGTGLTLSGGYDLHNDRDNLVRASVGASWANSSMMQTFYGVSAEQSAASGNPAYRPKAGVSDVGAGITWRHAFSREWVGTVGAGVTNLQTQAADSPLAERKTNWGVGAAIGYRF